MELNFTLSNYLLEQTIFTESLVIEVHNGSLSFPVTKEILEAALHLKERSHKMQTILPISPEIM